MQSTGRLPSTWHSGARTTSGAGVERRAARSERADLPLPDAARDRVIVAHARPDQTFPAAPGQHVAAPVDGKVVFAGTFKRYGWLLILEHEREYHTLLRGFARLDVKRGDQVRVGQIVGIMDARDDDPPVLHVGGATADQSTWQRAAMGSRLMRKSAQASLSLGSSFWRPICRPGGPQAESSDTFRQLKLFDDVFERVREYVEEITDEQLIEAAINGMLTSLDPHSGYLDAKKYRDMQVQTKGEFGGLGIEVTMEDGLVKVVSPIDDTPAYRAGIQAGDVITHINSEPVLGMAAAGGRADARPGRHLDRPDRPARPNEPIDVSMARAVITISPVRWQAEEDIGYVRVTTFNEQTESKVRGSRGFGDRARR